MRQFETGATRDSDDSKFDYEGFLSPTVLKRFAAYMHEHRVQADGKLRASDNWQKGIPKSAYMKSLLRHVMDLWLRWRDGCENNKAVEDTLCAILFNAQGLLHERMRDDDAPSQSEVSDPGQRGLGECLVGTSSLENQRVSYEEYERGRDKKQAANNKPLGGHFLRSIYLGG